MPTYQETREQVKQGITKYIMDGHLDLAADLIGLSFELKYIHNFDQPVLNDQDIWNFNQAMLEARITINTEL